MKLLEQIVGLAKTDERCGIQLIDNIVVDTLGYGRMASKEELAEIKVEKIEVYLNLGEKYAA